MLSYSVYKVVHLSGILLLFMSLGGLILGRALSSSKNFSHRRFLMIAHGVGLALIFVAGFGLLARLGLVGGWPGWVWVKVVLWLLLGGVSALILRKPEKAKLWWSLCLIAGIFAAYLANYKPF